MEVVSSDSVTDNADATFIATQPMSKDISFLNPNVTNEKNTAYSRQHMISRQALPYQASALNGISFTSSSISTMPETDSTSPATRVALTQEKLYPQMIFPPNPMIGDTSFVSNDSETHYTKNEHLEAGNSVDDSHGQSSISNGGGTDIFGQPKTWAESLADESILRAGSNATHDAQNEVEGHFSLVASEHHQDDVPSVAAGLSASLSSTGGSVKFVNATMELLQSQIRKDDAPKKKRTRTTTEQLRILQKAFNTDPMPSAAARLTLAKKLGMSPRAVQVWFQNRRAKGKLDQKRSELSASVSPSNPNVMHSQAHSTFPCVSSASFMQPIRPGTSSHALHPVLLTTPLVEPLSQSEMFVGVNSCNPVTYATSTNLSGNISENISQSRTDPARISSMEYQKQVPNVYSQLQEMMTGDRFQEMHDRFTPRDVQTLNNSGLIAHGSSGFRQKSLSFHHPDYNHLVQGYPSGRISVPNQYRYPVDAGSRPTGLGLENIEATQSYSGRMDMNYDSTYNVDRSNPMMASQPNTGSIYSYGGSRAYFPQNFQYCSPFDGSFVFGNDNEQKDIKSGNNHGVFIQMADVVPASVGGWKPLSLSANIAESTSDQNINHAYGRSYSLPPENGVMLFGSSAFDHPNLVFSSYQQAPQTANDACTQNSTNWNQQMAQITRPSGQFCYTTSYPGHAEQSHHIPMTKKAKNPKASLLKIDNSGTGFYSSNMQMVSPLGSMTVNNSRASLISASCTDNVSITRPPTPTDDGCKKYKRSASTPASPGDVSKGVGQLSGVDMNAWRDPASVQTLDGSLISTNQDSVMQGRTDQQFATYNQNSEISALNNVITPEALVNQRRMSRPSFSLPQGSTADLSRCVQLDASLVLPIGVNDLMAEGLDISNYYNKMHKKDVHEVDY